MRRRSDWQSRLDAYLLECARRPFRYGDLDCGLFVAGAVEAMTGCDVAYALRGYTSRSEAFARICGLCGTATIEAVADYLADAFGIREVAVLSAQRGDAVQLGRGRRSKLGLVAMHGNEILLPARSGLLRVPLDKAGAVRAWRI